MPIIEQTFIIMKDHKALYARLSDTDANAWLDVVGIRFWPFYSINLHLRMVYKWKLYWSARSKFELVSSPWLESLWAVKGDLISMQIKSLFCLLVEDYEFIDAHYRRPRFELSFSR